MKKRRRNKLLRNLKKPVKKIKEAKPSRKMRDKQQSKPRFSVIEGKKPALKQNRIIFGAICAVLVVAFVIGSAMSPVSISESFSSMSAVSGAGEGFPVLIEEGSSKNLHYAHSQILTLTDTHLLSFNSKGKRVYQRLHGFANPVVSSSQGRTLVYDRGGKNYHIENAQNTVFSGACEQRIITASMSDCGSYVFATESDSSVSSATVFDKNNVAVYRYNSAKSQILFVAINENGKQIAIATVSSQNAEFESEVLVYNINSTECVASYKIKKQIPVSMNYISSDKIRIITNKNVYHFNANGKKEVDSFNKMQVSSFKENEDKSVVIGLSADIGASKGKVMLINSKGKVEGSFNVNCSISDIAWSGNRIYILTDKLYVFSKAGKLIKTKKVGSGAITIRAFSSSVAVLSATRLELFTI